MSIRTAAARIVPRSLRRGLRRLEARARGFHHACPLCERWVPRFIPLAAMMPTLTEQWRRHHFDMQLFEQAETLNLEHYACPCCSANDRSRLYALFIRQQLQTSPPPARPKMLDIAPAETLQRWIRRLNAFEYRSADLFRDDVDDRVDITHMTAYADNAFDCFLCSHVIEHVADDRQALRELRRILKPGGWGIVMAPVSLALSETIEDITLTDPAERVRRFGQDDHLRMYAKADFTRRLTDAGFVVDALGIAHFGAAAFARYGLTRTSVLYICRKSA